MPDLPAAARLVATRFFATLAAVLRRLTKVAELLGGQGLAFGVDLWTLERWPARRVNECADYLPGRVVLVHLSIIAGMVLAA